VQPVPGPGGAGRGGAGGDPRERRLTAVRM
jgi:hypothetical protein